MANKLCTFSFKIDVTSKGSVTSIAFGSVIGAGAAADPTYDKEDGESIPELTLQSTGDFQRVTVGGSFKCEAGDLCNGKILLQTQIFNSSRCQELNYFNILKSDLNTLCD